MTRINPKLMSTIQGGKGIEEVVASGKVWTLDMCRKLSEMKGSREVGGSCGGIDARGVDTIHWIGS